jgi:mRNA-degrading endonuclease RelE of RelBE toxin-antitoxin system
MKIIYASRYVSEFCKLNDKIQKLVLLSEKEIIEAEVKEEIFQLKPLRKKNYFSINIGKAHRIGVKIKEGVVLLITIGDRAHIYNKFP